MKTIAGLSADAPQSMKLSSQSTPEMTRFKGGVSSVKLMPADIAARTVESKACILLSTTA